MRASRNSRSACYRTVVILAKGMLIIASSNIPQLPQLHATHEGMRSIYKYQSLYLGKPSNLACILLRFLCNCMCPGPQEKIRSTRLSLSTAKVQKYPSKFHPVRRSQVTKLYIYDPSHSSQPQDACMYKQLRRLSHYNNYYGSISLPCRQCMDILKSSSSIHCTQETYTISHEFFG